MNDMECTLDDKQLVKKARVLIHGLCHGKEWIMHIPADMNNDPDIIFSELCRRFESKQVTTHDRNVLVEPQKGDENGSI